jgi:hypothetical protein
MALFNTTESAAKSIGISTRTFNRFTASRGIKPKSFPRGTGKAVKHVWMADKVEMIRSMYWAANTK